MKDFSFSWSAKDLDNLDNLSLRFVTHPSPLECLEKETWDYRGELIGNINKGDILGLVDKGVLIATGIVCYIQDEGYRVWWACKELNFNLKKQEVSTDPSPKYLLHELKNAGLARIITRTANRFGR